MNFWVYKNKIFYNIIDLIISKKEKNYKNFEFSKFLSFYNNVNLISFFKIFYFNAFSGTFCAKFPVKFHLSKKIFLYKSYNSNRLIITDSYAILPYTKKELCFYFSSYSNEYSCLDDVIEKEFTKPYKISYSNSYINRFKEIYNLLRNKELLDFFTSFRQAFKYMYNSKINPIVVSACKSEQDFNAYLSSINTQGTNIKLPFDIIYKISPTC